MNLKKVIIYLFFTIIFLVALQRCIVNIIYANQSDLHLGIVTNTDVFTDVDGRNTMNSYTLKDSNRNKFDGVYSDKDNYSISISDTIEFRKLYNGSIRELKLNGQKIQNYYGFWDYGSVLIILIYVILFFIFPKLRKRMKESERKRISKILE